MLFFCLNHNYIKSDKAEWLKPRRPVAAMLQRLKKPAFHLPCPDCKAQDDAIRAFVPK